MFWISIHILSETFLILRKIQHGIITYTGLHTKHLLFLSDFNENEIFHLQVHAEVMAAGMIMYSHNGNKQNVAYSCIIAHSKWKMRRIPITKENFHGKITHTICFLKQQIFQSYFVSVFLDGIWELKRIMCEHMHVCTHKCFVAVTGGK